MDIPQRLLKHYLPLLVLSLIVIFSFNAIFLNPPRPSPGFWINRISFTTAYVAFLWIGITLMIGTWYLVRGRSNPPNDYLRRDIGIWAGVVSCVHAWAGLHVHLRGKMYLYFFKDGEPWTLRGDAFGWANHTGLLALVLVIFLMVVSNNYCVRKLGLVRWKNLQRYNYLMAGLVVIHAMVYFMITKRNPALQAWFYSFTMLVLIAQLAGIWVSKMVRRKALKALAPTGVS